MKAIFAAGASALALFASAHAAIATATADCPGTSDPAITCATDASRNDLANVDFAGSGDGAFFSLGLGGSATFEIFPAFVSPGTVIEVTFGGSNSAHAEAADISVSSDGISFTPVGTATNQTGTSDFNATTLTFAGGPFSFIRFVDVTGSTFASSSSTDGFDLDAFEVQTVPVPGAALLFPLGLAGLAAARRKRRAA